jgi:transposase-like protein
MAEKTRLIEETLEPGISVSFVARKHGLSPSLLSKRRQRIAEDGREAVRVDHEMIGAAASSGRHAVALCAVGRGRKSKVLSCLQALGGRGERPRPHGKFTFRRPDVFRQPDGKRVGC